MGFWAFANSSPYLTVLALLIVGLCIVECVGHIAKACGSNGRAGKVDGKLEIKVAPKASEKAH